MKANKQVRLSYTAKAKKIVSQMSLEEKVYLMSGRVSMEEMLEDFKVRHYNWRPYPAGGNDRLGVPEMKFVDGAWSRIRQQHLFSGSYGKRRCL